METVRCQTVVRRGTFEPEIIAVAKEQGCDLIILSTHGRTGLERLLPGRTAERVVRHAGCPLLIVRSNECEFVTREGDEWQPAEKRAESTGRSRNDHRHLNGETIRTSTVEIN